MQIHEILGACACMQCEHSWLHATCKVVIQAVTLRDKKKIDSLRERFHATKNDCSSDRLPGRGFGLGCAFLVSPCPRWPGRAACYRHVARSLHDVAGPTYRGVEGIQCRPYIVDVELCTHGAGGSPLDRIILECQNDTAMICTASRFGDVTGITVSVRISYRHACAYRLT
jgi:hypothetical protein